MLHSLMLSPVLQQSKHCPGHELDQCMLTTDAALLLSTMRRFTMVLTHSQHPLDITLGEQSPWWIVIAQTLSLREIMQGGIIQVVADLEYQAVILMITTVDGHLRMWYCQNSRQLKTQRF